MPGGVAQRIVSLRRRSMRLFDSLTAGARSVQRLTEHLCLDLSVRIVRVPST